MNLTVFVTFWLIVLARIVDVSLDTVRMVSVVQGRRGFAAVLGFFQALVFICAVAKVLLNMSQPAYAFAYAVGFATGTYLGMLIEQRLAFGRQLVFLLTPKGPELAEVLRAGDYRLAELRGHTRDGDLTILSVDVARREAQKLIRIASAVDERCIVIVHDIRRSEFARRTAVNGRMHKLAGLFPGFRTL
ncbi:MAG TPA: DUF5698 domain-containing protein [Verrucomicrobiae bacterium]